MKKIFAAAFVLFLLVLASDYYTYISGLNVPISDGAVYLQNARGWLSGSPLPEADRPPFISWLIAGVWWFTGESWTIVKPLQAIFTIGAGLLLYATLRKYKGDFFAFAVAALTMLNSQVFFYSSQILAEGISLFFLVAALFFLKSERPNHWFLAGVSLGLTYASSQLIFLQAAAIFLAESLVRKSMKLTLSTIAGALLIISLVLSAIFLKTGALPATLLAGAGISFPMSWQNLANSMNIWGPVFLLVPLALFSKRTYRDNYHFSFIAWFIISILFWGASSMDPYRFAIQFTPAVYFLAILAIENIMKSEITFSGILLGMRTNIITASNRLRLMKEALTDTKLLKEIFHGALSLVVLAFVISLYFSNIAGIHFIEASSPVRYTAGNGAGFENGISGITGYYSYQRTDAGSGDAYGNMSCRFAFPDKKTIILRMDDVQGYGWSQITMNLTDTVLEKGKSITLGVIPMRNIDKDTAMRKYLIARAANPRVELAQHGVYHSVSEYGALSEWETYNLTEIGYKQMVNVLNVYPVTLIPPNNEYSVEIFRSLSELGFVVLSARQNEYKFEENLVHIGYTVATRLSGDTELTPVPSVLDACRSSLESKNICVIMLHPQDYAAGDGVSLDKKKYEEFLRLLDGLDGLNARYATFKDLIECRTPAGG